MQRDEGGNGRTFSRVRKGLPVSRVKLSFCRIGLLVSAWHFSEKMCEADEVRA
jgi:hypothetical protein